MDNTDNKKKYYRNCTNCGKRGHEYKECRDPIVSYGIILLKFSDSIKDTDKLFKQNSILASDIDIQINGIRGKNVKDLEIFSALKNCISFLMIRRKHTLGYIEFVRGRYKTDNIDGIIFLFQQMTRDEIIKISKYSYDELWNDLWGDNDKKILFEQEFMMAKNKFSELKNGENDLGLAFYVTNVSPAWDQAEWGFPKGRRSKNESYLECAKREFEEESGFNSNDYDVVTEITPLVEEFIGTNGIRYKHVYYIAIAKFDKAPILDTASKNQGGEIGAIGYYTYDESVQMIRPYHIERKKIVTRLFMFLLNKLIINLNKDE